MNCLDITKSYLKENNYDGLVNSEGECDCSIDDLNPCCESFSECKPAYIKNGNCKECKKHCEGYDEDGNAQCFTTKKPESK